MEKVAHGQLHEGTTQKEMKMAEEQEELSESHYHHI
jgi:hypothetical protein